jgi:two-component system, NarL family, response regulator DevR
MNRVLLVDDHAVYREALGLILEQRLDLRVVAQVASIDAARPWFADVELGIVGLTITNGACAALLREWRAANPAAPILVLSESSERSDLAMAIEAGATGVLAKTTSLAEIIESIQLAWAGESLLPPQEMIDLLRMASLRREHEYAATETLNRLTPRELEILQVLAEGLSDREIGERLHISTETVRTHFVNILGKLHVSSRIQALVFAVRHGAVQIRAE